MLNLAYSFEPGTAAPASYPVSTQTVRTTQTALRSSLITRNITVKNRHTSMRLEPEMWNGLREICRREKLTVHTICTAVAQRKPANSSLTAAIRVFIMAYFRAAATEEGHTKAGHGPNGSYMTNWRDPEPPKG